MTEKVIVSVSEGKIRGIKKKSEYDGAEYYAFFGVPYGQSTAGQARFKDPVPAKPWNNVLDCSIERDGCFQFSIRKSKFAGSEDCLYNNIYTPQLPSNDTLKPVVFMIHPGGFVHGSPEPYYFGSPDHVMNRDIVYVAVAYRLHILGFLNLGLEECSGNQGMKDILLSLRWVRKNIQVFGGDPANITILGSSSGSALVSDILLSPPARGLFDKAVVMGIYSICPTVVAREHHVNVAFDLAESMGYNGNTNDCKKLLQFLKKLDIKSFITLKSEKEINQNAAQLFPSCPFVPSYDQGKAAIMPIKGRKMVEEITRVPLIFGMCDKEAAMGFTRVYRKMTMKNFYSSYRQNYWGWGGGISDNDVKLIKERMDSFYFNGGSTENATLDQLVDIQSDIAYSDSYDSLIGPIARDLPNSVFVYKFDFEGNVTSLKDRIDQGIDETIHGNMHAHDFGYWAYLRDTWGVKTPCADFRTRRMIDKFTKLICNFARNGDPNYDGFDVHWRPSTPENPCYLNINDEIKLVEGRLTGKSMDFWDEMKKQFMKRDMDQINIGKKSCNNDK